MSEKVVQITVQYVGHAPFTEEVHGDPVLKEIKLSAMRKFDLEASAADKYVLQENGVDLKDDAHVSSLGQGPVVLVLHLKQEVPKGASISG